MRPIMNKPESHRLIAENYPFSIVIPPRFGDLDVYRHLNNVAYARYFEEGRVQFQLDTRAREHFAKTRGLIVGVEIAYLAEGRYPDPVTITAGFGAAGRTSWHVLLAAFQNGQCIATCDSVMASRDENGAAPFTDEWRELIAARPVATG
jgi:acyl-CoA thioester hydrolase